MWRFLFIAISLFISFLVSAQEQDSILVFGIIKDGDTIYEDADRAAQEEGPLPESFFGGISGEHEQLMEIINSMENDERRIFSANVVNNGAVPNLQKDAVIEIPAIATPYGFFPVMMNNFPDGLAGIVAKHLAISEVAVEAALKGDRKLFAEAILMGGYISDEASVMRMVDELIKAQIEYLPQFK